ncbi:MAG TPA: flagellar hook-length control protein FliK [Vicinamibacterales bacterium]
MWIASVPAAAAPLPGVAPAAAPSGEAAPFDEALAASLIEEQPEPADGAPAPGVGQFRLVEWLLGGISVEKPAPQPPAESTSPEAVVEEELESAGDADEEAEEISADVLLVAPTAQQPAIELTITPMLEMPALPPVIGDQSNNGGGSRQEAATMLNAAATPNATTADITAPAQAAPAGEIRAAEPRNTIRPDVPVMSDVAESVKTEPSASAVRSAEASAPAVTSADANALRPVTASAAASTSIGADTRHPARAEAPALPVVTLAEPPSTPSAASAPAAAEAAPAASVVPAGQGIERDARDTTTPMSRVMTPAVPAAPVNPQMGGGDAQGFESDGRRSPAAQRLAAALSMAASGISRDSAPAPVFSVPVQPSAVAAPVAPVVVAAPATGSTNVDAENVHNLVEAMRITAKAGGWEATVRLKPEHLGEVTIALRVDGKNVSAVVQAESAGVRQWLMSQEEAVRSGLSEHGLQLDRFAVSRDGQRREAEHQQPQHQQRRRGQRQADSGSQPRFEVVV